MNKYIRCQLGMALLQWHRSGGCPVYQLGSHWMGNHPVLVEVVEAAIEDLEHILDVPPELIARVVLAATLPGSVVPEDQDDLHAWIEQRILDGFSEDETEVVETE